MKAPRNVKRVTRRSPEPLPLGEFLEDQVAASGDLDGLALPLAGAEAKLPLDLKQRLLSSIGREHRFGVFEQRFSELFDLPESVAGVLLGRLDSKEHWTTLEIPGVELFHFDGGPRVRDAITGFVRIDSGASFPMHEHVGHERVLVMQGVLRDDDGELYFPGDEIEMDADSTHSLSSSGAVPLVFATIVMKGIKIDGQLILPGDPRA